MSEQKQSMPGGLMNRNVDKIDAIHPVLLKNLGAWLYGKPTGSASFTISIDANQGGIGKMKVSFTTNESI